MLCTRHIKCSQPSRSSPSPSSQRSGSRAGHALSQSQPLWSQLCISEFMLVQSFRLLHFSILLHEDKQHPDVGRGGASSSEDFTRTAHLRHCNVGFTLTTPVGNSVSS